MKNIFKALLVMSTLVVSLNASAAFIFNFEDHTPADNMHSVNYMSGGNVLTVAAFNGAAASDVHRGTGGLGVTGGPGGNQIHSPEMLTFSLDNAFEGVVTILFSAWNHHDEADVELTSGGTMTFSGTNGSSFDFNLSGTSGFSVAAVNVNLNRDDNDSFRIKEIQFVETAMSIAEPSTLALFGLSLFAIGMRIRQRIIR